MIIDESGHRRAEIIVCRHKTGAGRVGQKMLIAEAAKNIYLARQRRTVCCRGDEAAGGLALGRLPPLLRLPLHDNLRTLLRAQSGEERL